MHDQKKKKQRTKLESGSLHDNEQIFWKAFTKLTWTLFIARLIENIVMYVSPCIVYIFICIIIVFVYDVSPCIVFSSQNVILFQASQSC